MAITPLYNTLSAIISGHNKVVERISGIQLNGSSTQFLAADGNYHEVETDTSTILNSVDGDPNQAVMKKIARRQAYILG